MAEKEYIEREALFEAVRDKSMTQFDWSEKVDLDEFEEVLNNIPTADVVEVDKVAEMLRIMFDDDCACNYNGNDEWLPMLCKYAETDCPMPKERLGCWKEFVKHFLAKMDGKDGV